MKIKSPIELTVQRNMRKLSHDQQNKKKIPRDKFNQESERINNFKTEIEKIQLNRMILYDCGL